MMGESGQRLFFGGVSMVATCPVCREVTHSYAGYFVQHGCRAHGVFVVCAGSGSPVTGLDCYCG